MTSIGEFSFLDPFGSLAIKDGLVQIPCFSCLVPCFSMMSYVFPCFSCFNDPAMGFPIGLPGHHRLENGPGAEPSRSSNVAGRRPMIGPTTPIHS